MIMEQRRSPRRPASFKIELAYPTGETLTVVSRDISDNGIFLLLEESSQPIIGEIVSLKLVDESVNEAPLPSNEAAVVRLEPEGIGLSFIVMDFVDDL